MEYLQKNSELVYRANYSGSPKYPLMNYELPEEFDDYVNLTSLTVSFTYIKCLRVVRPWFDSLTYLDLSHNSLLTTLPKDFCKLRALRMLYLNNTELEELPGNLDKLDQLFLLNISYNFSLKRPEQGGLVLPLSLECILIKKTSIKKADILDLGLPKLVELYV